MSINIDNEKEKQQEGERKQLYIKDLEELDKILYERETKQTSHYYTELSKLIYDLITEIVSEWVNRNFKYQNNKIVIRNRAKISNKWVVLISIMYEMEMIKYDKEKKKFIINAKW